MIAMSREKEDGVPFHLIAAMVEIGYYAESFSMVIAQFDIAGITWHQER